MIFQTMYLAACVSSQFSFRDVMHKILVKTFLPRMFSATCLSPVLIKGKPYYFIEATTITLLDYEFFRLRWLEKLKVIHLYLFIVNHDVEATIARDDGFVLRNRWAYDQVTQIIPANRIAIMGRGNPHTIFGLPELPKMYNVLDVFTEPPTFQEKKWEDFHDTFQEEYTAKILGR